MNSTTVPADWEVWFPKEMLNLSQPWRELRGAPERIATISLTYDEMIKALGVLELGFHVLPRLPHPPYEEVLPEPLVEFPSITISAITIDIPTFDDFYRDPFVKTLDLYVRDYPPHDVERLAQLWVHMEVRSLIARVHNWIIETLHEMRDPELVTSYIALVRSAWRNVSMGGLVPFIAHAKSIAVHAGIPDAAVPFMDEVLAAPDLDSEQRDWANYLRQELQAASAANKQ